MKLSLLYICFLGWLVLYPLHNNAQTRKIDSLTNALKREQEDTAKVNTLYLLSKSLYMAGDYKPSDSVANISLSLAEKLNFKKGIANASQMIGNDYQSIGQYSKSIVFIIVP